LADKNFFSFVQYYTEIFKSLPFLHFIIDFDISIEIENFARLNKILRLFPTYTMEEISEKGKIFPVSRKKFPLI